MDKPTDDEFKLALAEAGRMRESGNDPHHVARALLNLNYCMNSMQGVLEATIKKACADDCLTAGSDAEKIFH